MAKPVILTDANFEQMVDSAKAWRLWTFGQSGAARAR